MLSKADPGSDVTPFDFTVLFLCNAKNWCETSMSSSYSKGTERASVTAASSNINTVRKRIWSLGAAQVSQIVQ